MEIQGNNQLELFSESNSDSLVRGRQSNGSFAAYIRRYEKTVLIIIAIITTCIVSFSLGVEKGKRISTRNYNSRIDLPMQVSGATQARAITAKAVTIPAPLPEKQQLQQRTQQPASKQQDAAGGQKIQQLMGSFTIQLASYKSKTSAQKEAEVLKRKGFTPLILSKGSFNVLCVGNFSTKKEAQSVLSELKKRYTGCYIRRL